MSDGELVRVPIEMRVTWRYASGAAMEHFCAKLVEKTIVAMRCGGCGRRYLPPRPFCGNCCLEMTEWVPVSDEGTIEAFTTVYLPILDGRTGKMRPVPYGMALIKLDGADTTLNHYLVESDPARLAIGKRVRAVWRDELFGAMDDIRHFELVEV